MSSNSRNGFVIEWSGSQTYRLKDWNNPQHATGIKPMHVNERFSWVGPLRDDFTVLPTEEEAKNILTVLREQDGNAADDLTIRPHS